jgi:hypothetical protein
MLMPLGTCIHAYPRLFAMAQSTRPNHDLPRLPTSLPVLLVGVHGLNGHGLVAPWTARTHLHHEPLVSKREVSNTIALEIKQVGDSQQESTSKIHRTAATGGAG